MATFKKLFLEKVLTKKPDSEMITEECLQGDAVDLMIDFIENLDPAEVPEELQDMYEEIITIKIVSKGFVLGIRFRSYYWCKFCYVLI